MTKQLLVLLTPQIPPYFLSLLMSSKNGTWRWRSGSLPRNNVGGTTGIFPFSRLPYFSLALLNSLIIAVNNNHINKNQTTLILRVNNLLAQILLNMRVKFEDCSLSTLQLDDLLWLVLFLVRVEMEMSVGSLWILESLIFRVSFSFKLFLSYVLYSFLNPWVHF